MLSLKMSCVAFLFFCCSKLEVIVFEWSNCWFPFCIISIVACLDLHLQRNFCFSLVLKSVVWTRPEVSFYLFELLEFLCQATNLSFRLLYFASFDKTELCQRTPKWAWLRNVLCSVLRTKMPLLKPEHASSSFYLPLKWWGHILDIHIIRSSVAHNSVNCDTLLLADYLGFQL